MGEPVHNNVMFNEPAFDEQHVPAFNNGDDEPQMMMNFADAEDQELQRAIEASNLAFIEETRKREERAEALDLATNKLLGKMQRRFPEKDITRKQCEEALIWANEETWTDDDIRTAKEKLKYDLQPRFHY